MMVMKTNFNFTFQFIIMVIILVLAACERDPVDVGGDGLDFSRGVFIVNEGNFLAGNASLSFYDPVLDTVYNEIFYRENQAPLGDVANSMIIAGDRAYIAVNNSGRIYIFDPSSLEYQGKITGLTSPRNLAAVNEHKLYVTDLYDSRLSIIDPGLAEQADSATAVGFIDMGGYSSEQIIISGSRAFVACWSYGDKVMVIDTGSDSLIDSIQVGKQPNSMALDKEGYIWVLCDGGYYGSPYGQENASLWKVDTQSGTAAKMLQFSEIMDSPSELTLNAGRDTLFYLNGDVYRLATSKVHPEVFIESKGKWYYSMGLDPYDNTVYLSDAVDFVQNGWIYRYDMQKVMLDSFRVGINPGGFCFAD
jgi:hypothetical protein